jgi:hypothetical protein
MAPLVLPAVLTVCGVDASRRQPAQDPAPVFSSSADLVVVDVTVTDRRGACVSDLPRDAFSTRDGAFRRIRVTVTDPGRRALVVRARDGYPGGPSRGR